MLLRVFRCRDVLITLLVTVCATWPCRSKWEKNNDLQSLNKGEATHALSSFLFFANKGKFDNASILQQVRYFWATLRLLQATCSIVIQFLTSKSRAIISITICNLLIILTVSWRQKRCFFPIYYGKADVDTFKGYHHDSSVKYL